MSDSIAVLTWWLLVQIFSLVGLPVAFRLFHRLPDRGYGVSKALGLLLPSYLFWLLGVLGFLRNDAGSILLSLAVTATGALLFYFRDRPPESPIPNPQYPVPNPQSPIPNPISPSPPGCAPIGG